LAQAVKRFINNYAGFLDHFFSRYLTYKNVCLLVCKAAPFLFRSGLGLDVPRK
jgi:hypothetical protein